MGSLRVFCEHFVLIGAMNPCPCGYYGDPVQECTCFNAMVTRYQKPIPSPSLRTGSGPLLDHACEGHRLTYTSRCRGWNTKSSPMTAWASPRPVLATRQTRSGSGWRPPACGRRRGSLGHRCWPMPTLRRTQGRHGAGGGAGPLPAGRRPYKTGISKNLPCSPSEPAAMKQHPEGTRMSARAYHGKTQSVSLGNSGGVARILKLATRSDCLRLAKGKVLSRRRPRLGRPTISARFYRRGSGCFTFPTAATPVVLGI
jgi:hypothetical protein